MLKFPLIIKILLFFSTTVNAQHVAASAVIIEPPKNQYILVGGEATLTCKTQGAKRSFWSINGNATGHLVNTLNLEYYERLGVVFNHSNNVNLTMTVPAFISTKVNNIICVAQNKNYFSTESAMVQIYVFKSFRPLPPSTINISTVNASAILIQWTPSFLWDNYTIDYYIIKVNLTNLANESSSSLASTINSTNQQFHYPTPFLSCATFNVIVMAVNVHFGESDPISVIVGFDADASVDPDLHPPCSPYKLGKKSRLPDALDGKLLRFQVGMGVCIGFALLMLFLLINVLLCFLSHRQQKISQGKQSNLKSSKLQNGMVRNASYDYPGHENVQQHFDTLTATVKPNLTPSSTSLSNQSMLNNNNPRSTTMCASGGIRNIGLKKDGKERNELCLTLTPSGSESVGQLSVEPSMKDNLEWVGNSPGNHDDDGVVGHSTCNGDEKYVVMHPIKGKIDKNKIIERMIEQNPKDTD